MYEREDRERERETALLCLRRDALFMGLSWGDRQSILYSHDFKQVKCRPKNVNAFKNAHRLLYAKRICICYNLERIEFRLSSNAQDCLKGKEKD